MDMITSNTANEIITKVNTIMKEHMDISSINNMLSDYNGIPEFVLPFFQSVYYKAIGNSGNAVEYMDLSLDKLKNDPVYTNLKDLFNKIEYQLIYEPFEKSLWGHAGEVFANVDREKDALEAYKKYLLITSRIEGDDISKGLLSFRPISKYSLSDILNNELTVCSPRVMNDPFDTLFLSWGEYYLKNLQRKKHIGPYTKAMDYYRIRSFSGMPNRRKANSILSNTLMWAHYADNHYGMCIEYQFSEKFTNNDSGVLRFRKVKYQLSKDKLSLDVPKINTDIGLLTKHSVWKYENEVRLITYMPEEKGDFVSLKLDSDSYIKSIYFGLRCPKRDIETV